MKDSIHVKNEHLYVIVMMEIVANQVFHGVVEKREKKLAQFVMCFHMISKGKPMINENMKKLLQFLYVKDCPKMHQSNTSVQGMAINMHELVINKTKGLVQVIRFISLSCDEITSDQQSWVSIHAYVVEDWQKKQMLLSLQHVVVGITSDALK